MVRDPGGNQAHLYAGGVIAVVSRCNLKEPIEGRCNRRG
jgi:hypothetical protein